LLCFVVALVAPCVGPLAAQDNYDLARFGPESGSFFARPVHWDTGDWLTLGLIGGGTFAAMQADEPVRTIVLRNGTYQHSTIVEFGRIWGESYMTPALAIGFTLEGWMTGDVTAKKIGFEIGQAAIYSAVITQILSKSVGRARPYQDLGRSAYQPFTFSGQDFHSLPGGHSTAAFVLSTVLSRNLSSRLLKVLVYAPAVLTVGARVYEDAHWTSDDLLGAAIGYFVTTWVVDQHESAEHRVGVSSLYPLTVTLSLR
jgi:membrane-associated phospholipid phosphatase